MNLVERQLMEIGEEFTEIDAEFDRYEYLLELADNLPPCPEGLRTVEHLVPGCHTQVWLNTYGRRGHFYFAADSDDPVDKGILFLLRDLLYGVSLVDVASANLNLIPVLHLNAGLAANYQNGVNQIVGTLQNAARRLCTVKQ